MNVLHITMSTTGGAGISCVRLHQGLLNNKVSSQVMYLQDKANISAIVPNLFPFKKIFFNSLLIKYKFWVYNKCLKKKLKNQNPGFEIFSSINSCFDITNHPLYQKANIIHLHWVCGFINFSSFFKKINKPVVWTLHDMFPFTGGCHHADGCEGFVYNCNNCPQLIGCYNQEFATKQLSRKKIALKDSPSLTIVGPSKWITKLSSKSALFKNYPHYTISNGINENLFKIIQRMEARKKMNLPNDKKIILFVAQSVNNPRKGIDLLLSSLHHLKIQDVLLVSIGKISESIFSKFPLINMGVINDPAKITLMYQAADVFVLPSIAENQPNTIIESLLCGTPVIAFAVGGISEMIDNGINGFLCEKINEQELARIIDLFFNTIKQFNRIDIRNKAIEKYSLTTQAAVYLSLYTSIIKNYNK